MEEEARAEVDPDAEIGPSKSKALRRTAELGPSKSKARRRTAKIGPSQSKARHHTSTTDYSDLNSIQEQLTAQTLHVTLRERFST